MLRTVAWLVVGGSLLTGCGLSLPALPLRDDAAVEVDAKVVDDTQTPVDSGQLVDRPDASSPTDIASLDVTEPDAPDVIELDVITPDVVTPDALTPDVVEPDALMPDVVAPDVVTPDVVAPDVVTPDVVTIDMPDVVTPDVVTIDMPDVVVPDMPDVVIAPIDVPPRWHVVDGTFSYTPWRSRMPGGPSDALCPAGELMVGARTWSVPYVNAIAVVCAPLLADGSLGAPHNLSTRGTTTGGDHTDVCPRGEAVIEVVSRTGDVTDNIGFNCAPVVGWISSGARGASMSTRGGSGGDLHADRCPAGTMSTGLQHDTDAYPVVTERMGQSHMRCSAVTP